MSEYFAVNSTPSEEWELAKYSSSMEQILDAQTNLIIVCAVCILDAHLVWPLTVREFIIYTSVML